MTQKNKIIKIKVRTKKGQAILRTLEKPVRISEKSGFLKLQLRKASPEVFRKATLLVSERVDTYNTIFNPFGMVSHVNRVVIDYNHNLMDTGAKFERFFNLKIPNLSDGGQTSINALAGVFNYTSETVIRDKDRDGREYIVDKLQKRIDDGSIKAGSVYAMPYFTEEEARAYERWDGLVPFRFERWGLIAFSLLGEPAGQEDSYFLPDKYINYNNNMPKFKKDQEVMLKGVVNEVIELDDTFAYNIEAGGMLLESVPEELLEMLEDEEERGYSKDLEERLSKLEDMVQNRTALKVQDTPTKNEGAKTIKLKPLRD